MVHSPDRENFIFRTLIASGLLGGTFGFISFIIGNFISIQNQNEQIFTEYIKEISTMILVDKIYKPDPGLDDINLQILAELSSDQLLDSDLKLTKVPSLDLSNTDIRQLAEEEHKEKLLIARAVTINSLRRLGDTKPVLTWIFPFLDNSKKLKAHLIKFLYESKLIGYCSEELKPLTKNGKCTNRIIELGDAKLNGAKINEVVDVLRGLKVPGAELNGADFSGIDLSYSNFRNARLIKTNFSNTILEGADFSGACIAGANFKDAEGLKSVNFKGADQNKSTYFPEKFDSSQTTNVEEIEEQNKQQIEEEIQNIENQNKTVNRITNKC